MSLTPSTIQEMPSSKIRSWCGFMPKRCPCSVCVFLCFLPQPKTGLPFTPTIEPFPVTHTRAAVWRTARPRPRVKRRGPGELSSSSSICWLYLAETSHRVLRSLASLAIDRSGRKKKKKRKKKETKKREKKREKKKRETKKREKNNWLFASEMGQAQKTQMRRPAQEVSCK